MPRLSGGCWGRLGPARSEVGLAFPVAYATLAISTTNVVRRFLDVLGCLMEDNGVIFAFVPQFAKPQFIPTTLALVQA